MQNNSASAYANSIKDIVQAKKPQMIVCIVPNTNKDVYDAIKRTCCNDFGIPSQVVTSNILNMNNMNKTKSVITKVAIQMNCKLGGEVWGVTIPVRFINEKSQLNYLIYLFNQDKKYHGCWNGLLQRFIRSKQISRSLHCIYKWHPRK